MYRTHAQDVSLSSMMYFISVLSGLWWPAPGSGGEGWLTFGWWGLRPDMLVSGSTLHLCGVRDVLSLVGWSQYLSLWGPADGPGPDSAPGPLVRSGLGAGLSGVGFACAAWGPPSGSAWWG